MQPRANDTICVTAETCGRRAIIAVIARKRITAGCFHHACLSDGVLSPMRAKMMLENPTTSADVQNHDAVPMRYANTRVVMLYVQSLRKRDHSDRQFTARWKIFAWKK